MKNRRHRVSHCVWQKRLILKKIASTVIIKNLMRQEIKKNEGIHVSSDLERSSKSKNRVQKMLERLSMSKNIFDKYNNWKHFFRKELDASALFKHQLWDHKINFISEK